MTTPGAWTDITIYVRSIDISRGRNHELSRSQAGTCSLRLTNTDRRFDPSNTAGPYYPNVIPMRRIRVRAVHNAVTYDLFQGYVENWGQTWPGRVQGSVGDAEVTLQAVDAFKLLSLFEVTGAYAQTVIAQDALAFWRLDENAGATAVVSSGTLAGCTLNSIGTPVTLGVTPGPLAGSQVADIAPDTAGAIQSGAVLPTALWPATGTAGLPLTVSFWANFDMLVDTRYIMQMQDSGSVLRYVFEFFTAIDKRCYARWNDGSGPYSAQSLPEFFIPGEWHHYAFTRPSSGLCRFYRDGVQISTQAVTGAIGARTGNVLVHIGGSETSDPDGGFQIAHVGYWQVELSADQIATQAVASLDSVDAGAAGTQITALLDAFGWPAGERSVDVGQSQMQAFSGSGSLLDILLGIAEDSERGLFQTRGDGVLVFHDRATMRGHVSQGTFGDSGAEFAYADLVLRYDDTDLYTRVTAGRTGGITVSVEDTAATAAYGPRTLSVSGLALASDADVDSLARSLLAKYSAPATRPVSMQLIGSAGSANTLWAQILGRETHHDKVTLLRRPPGGGATITLGANIEGIHHSIVPAAAWEVTYDLVPDSGAWILEDDVWGLLEQTTVLAW